MGHHRLSEERRLEVVFEHKSGKSIRDIAKKLGINKNTVSNIVKKHKSTGSVKDLPGRSRKKSTTQRQDSRLIRRSLNDRRLTSSDLKKVWQEECGINVTSRTVRSRLNEAGLKGCVAVKKPLLSKKNRKARFDWARAHKDWTVSDWSRVLWSDESSFELFNPAKRVFVRRRSGERYKEECIVPTVKFGGGSLMVWGCFSGIGTGFLYRVEGILDSKKYIRLLNSAMFPSVEKLFQNGEYIYQQDDAPCHKAKRVMEFFQRKGVSVMDWPVQSPDLNPIENLWTILKQKVHNSKPSSLDVLWETLNGVWNNIEESTIESLVASLPKRVKAVIAAKGEATRY